jgi:hypothetical protein
MNRPRHFDPLGFLGLALAALAALPACGTKDVSTDQVLRDNSLQPDANQGSVLIVFAPPDETYDQYLADPNPGGLSFFLVDGKQVVDSDDELFTAAPGAEFIAGNYEPGLHHFAINEVGGKTIFAGDGQITSGSLTRLYLYGPLNALQGRFVSYSFRPPAGQEHVSAINLVRSGGVEIEVVGCTDATTCTPISPPLAFGDTFDADLSASGLSAYGTSFSTTRLWLGYRQVATLSLPAPPVLPVMEGYGIPFPNPPIYIAAPEYLLADGTSPLSAD